MWRPVSRAGILVDSIVTLSSLFILPCPRSYSVGIHYNPTFPIHRIVVYLSDGPTDYPNPTGKGSILILPLLSILFFHPPTGGETYELDNHLAAQKLAPEPNDRIAL